MSPPKDLDYFVSQKIWQDIPASKLLDLKFLKIESGFVQTLLPLTPNSNHLGTLFGGSLYVQGVLTCYSAILSFARTHHLETNNIVIAHGEIDYLKPGKNSSTATAKINNESQLRIINDLKSDKKKAWIELEAILTNENEIISKVKGRYLLRLDK